VYSIIGDASLAKKCSPFPMPITKGLPFLAAIMVSGSSFEINRMQ
jgi:hypothetical protein